MENIRFDFDAYREYVQAHSNADLFVCINQFYRIQCKKEEISIQHSFVSGMSTCRYSQDSMDFFACNGIAKSNLIDFKLNPIAHSILHKGLPAQCVNSAEHNNIDASFSLINITENDCRIIWNKQLEQLSDYNFTLTDLMMHIQNDVYFYFSSTGNEGYSTRTLFSPGIIIQQSPACFFSIFPSFNVNDIANLIGIVNHRAEMLPIVNDFNSLQHVLFSGTAICDLVFYFAMMLSEPIVKAGNSAISYADIGTDCFSKVLNMEENSISNKIILGTVDGEGMPRIPSMIINHGKITSLFTSGIDNLGISSTGSAYRFSHTEIPQVRPSKVSLHGNESLEEIIKQHRDIILIDNLAGHRESISLKTSRFEAYSTATIIKNGIYTARCPIKLQTTLKDIFKNIICVANDTHYGADGSIHAGSILVESNNMIARI